MFRTPIMYCFLGLLVVSPARGIAEQVTYAGVAYAGTNSGKEQRFHYSTELEVSLERGFQGILYSELSGLHPARFELALGSKGSLNGSDQALSVALLISSEIVSVENLGPFYKIMAFVRAQALFFDMKSMSVVRAYPLSFVYLDSSTTEPTEQQKLEAIRRVYFGANGKTGILKRFEAALTAASLPNSVSKTVGVSIVTLAPDVVKAFPPGFSADDAQTWIADQAAEAISTKAGVPVLPYKKGHIHGVLALSFDESSKALNLEIPESDYKVDIEMPQLRIVTFSEQAAGKSLIYASYATVRVERPLSSDFYLNAAFKNGVTKVIPAGQIATDDFPAYQDSILDLFNKIADAVEGARTPWLKAATSTPDIDRQLIATREVFAKCN